MTALHILEDYQAEMICGGYGPDISIYLSKTINKVSYDQTNSLQNNVGAKVLSKGAVLAASITSTQLNSIGGVPV